MTEPKECAENEFKCVDSLTNVMCIPDSWQCDGSADCDDESDERGCPKNHCGIYAFACATGVECIHEAWVCDGGIDCPDGSDEWNCKSADLLPVKNISSNSTRSYYVIIIIIIELLLVIMTSLFWPRHSALSDYTSK